jgi:hypothetical protein
VLRGLLLASPVLLAACATPAPSTDSVTPVGSELPTVIASVATALPGAAAGWMTYVEPTLGYSLSFPEDVEFTYGTSKAGIYTARLQFTLPGVDGYQGMVLRVEPNPERRGIEQVAQEIYSRGLLSEPPADALQQFSDVTVAGLSGVQVGTGPDFSLVVPYEDYTYIIAPVHDVATTAADPQTIALFYEILSTLRIAP